MGKVSIGLVNLCMRFLDVNPNLYWVELSQQDLTRVYLTPDLSCQDAKFGQIIYFLILLKKIF